VSYIDISGTFCYLCSILGGYSRYIVNWYLRESMTEADIEIILEWAKELHPEARTRIISDNRTAVHRKGLQGVHSDLWHDQRQNFALLSPIEWKNRTLAQIAQGRVHPAGNAAVAGRCAASVERYVDHYNNVRLNSAIGYITPKDMLAGRQQEIHAERDRKLEEARKQRQIRRQQAA
jgi:putative transposase